MSSRDLSSSEIVQAKEAISVLSSLLGPGPSNTNGGDSSLALTEPSSSTASTAHVPASISSSSATRSSTSQDSSGVLKAADRALNALATMRSGLRGGSSRKRLRSELRNAFNSKKSTKQSKVKCEWKHRFVCLAWRDQPKIPTTDAEKDELLEAGLGEKLIEFPSLAISSEQLKEILLSEFPKLRDGGGFEFCKCLPNTRRLTPLTSVAYSSLAMLKERVGAARTYIRPLQRDLEIDVVCDLPEGPMEECITCGMKFSLQSLKDHIEICQSSEKSTESPSPIQSPWSPQPSSIRPNRSFSPELPPAFPLWTEEELQDRVPDDDNPIIVLGSEDGELHPPVDTNDETDVVVYSQPKSLKDVAKDAQALINDKKKFFCIVRRDFVLGDCLKRMEQVGFSPLNKITVNFIGESGVDTGGMTREFFTIIARDIAAVYMNGGTFSHNSVALQDEIYLKLGQLAAMAFGHGAASFHILTPSVYNYISTMSVANIVVCVEDMPEGDTKEFVKKVMRANNQEEVRELAMQHINLILACGYTKAASTILWEDRVELVQSITLHQVILESKAEIDQFTEGLKHFNVLAVMKEHPNLLKEFFCLSIKNPSPENILTMFNINWSEKGSNSRKAEEQVYINFVQYLENCERAEDCCSREEQDLPTLRMIIAFFSGGEEIPPIGFSHEPQLFFNPNNVFPTASTCAIQLTLPTRYSTYSSFQSAMNTGFMFHGGFGLE